MTVNETDKTNRYYLARRNDDTVVVVETGDSGLEVPIIGALRCEDGTIIVESASPVPNYVLRDALNEVERIFAGDENGGKP